MTIYSYSRVNTYFTCPAQFQFRYIERRPSPVAEGIELFLGSRFHETMEYLYEQVSQRVPTVNETVDHFKNLWTSHWTKALQTQKDRGFPDTLRVVQEGQTAEDYRQKGMLFVENYYHQYHPFDQERTEGIERRVAFNLDPKGQFKMQGYIDRLGRDDDGILWIHDYKTSSRKMSEEDAQTEDQLALYQIGLEQDPKFGPKETIKLVWHFVAFQKDQVVAERDPKQIGKLKERYISKIQTIEKARSYPTKPGVLCRWCEYLTVCSDGRLWVENRAKKTESKAESPAGEVAAKPLSAAVLENPVKAVSPAPAGAASPGTSQRTGKPENDPTQEQESSPATPAQEKKTGRKKASLAAVSADQLPLF